MHAALKHVSDTSTARVDGPPDQRRQLSAPLRLLDRYRAVVLSAGGMYLALASLVPVLMTPYRGDDALNKMAPTIWGESGHPLVVELLRESKVQILDWMHFQGRFFPGSVLWTFSVFSTFQSRVTYKLFLAFLVAVMIALVAWLVTTLTGEPVAAAIAAVGLASTLTLRSWIDGLDSFSGLLPLTISLAVASTLLLLRGKGRTSVIVAVILWCLALTTYEVVIVLTPVLCLVVWLARRGPGRSLALLWPTLVDGAFVLYLRAQASSVAPGYQANLDLGRVLVTYVKQTVAAAPLSALWFPGSEHVFSVRLAVMAVVLLGIPAALVLTCAIRARPDPSWRSLSILAIVGAAFVLLPPVLVAITVRWQDSLPRGQGYLSVVWGYVGIAIMMTVIVLALVKRLGARPSTGRRIAVVTATVVLSLLVALNIAGSLSIAEAFVYPVG